jgi:AcrR family transcriptional regulator
VPRISASRREARRGEIIDAARRCFSRDGFHQTSMPDIAAEAGVSVGAPYRYFASKEEIILEIAGDAFRMIFEPVDRLVSTGAVVSAAGLVEAAIEPIERVAGPVEELLRCAVQAWAELLRHEEMRVRALEGFERVRGEMADALRRGQAAGVVPASLDAERGTRVVMALLHGFVLQRAAFGLADVRGFIEDVRVTLGGTAGI